MRLGPGYRPAMDTPLALSSVPPRRVTQCRVYNRQRPGPATPKSSHVLASHAETLCWPASHARAPESRARERPSPVPRGSPQAPGAAGTGTGRVVTS